jgi:Beta-lactamase superfamily domain
MPDIQYLGRACVRIRGREGIVISDPFPKADGFDPGRPTAHIVTLSGTDERRINAGVVKPQREHVFVVDGPGEYEVGGIMITGIRTRSETSGAKRGYNTAYVMELDDLSFCHLGNLAQELSTSQLEEIGAVDVLFVPAQSTLSPAKLAETIASIEPRAVVPLYDSSEQLDRLAHELGLKEWEAQDKLSITRNSLPGDDDETRVIVLRPAAVTA